MNLMKNCREPLLGFQMAPMVDIVFLTLIFFMSTIVYYEMETSLSITVPAASGAQTQKRMPGEIIINVAKDGLLSVNQKALTPDELEQMLQKIVRLYEGQPVIIRADRLSFHKDVIKVLDICARTGIWNISFATVEGHED